MKPPEIIAELSCNHRGDLARALELVDAAKAAGANGIKVQCWEPERMVVDKTYVLPDGPWAGRNLFELYEEAHTPWSWIPAIFERAKRHSLNSIASVFDTEALAYLEDIGCPRYKIASFELVDTPLVEAVSKTGKPIILSTGMATDVEIWRAVKAAGKYANPPRDITLLHCVSAYPAPVDSMVLHRIPSLCAEFGVPVGLSDHSLGSIAAIVATTLGATMIEKHFTLSRAQGGPDAPFSIEPAELGALVRATRDAKNMVCWETVPGDRHVEMPQQRLRRSLYWTTTKHVGDEILPTDFISARPADGLPPSDANHLIGRVVRDTVNRGDPVKPEHISLPLYKETP